MTLAETGHAIRTDILRAEWPDAIARDIAATPTSNCERSGGGDRDVAVRSSATAEDLPEASFAGQQETFLNIRGRRGLLDACRRCFASLFTDRAIAYRQAHGFDHMKVALSVGVQLMVRSDIGGSGVMFSIDTETGFEDVVFINAAWGLGETVVQGTVDPDEYQVFKPLLADRSLTPIVEKRLGAKAKKMIYAAGEDKTTTTVATSKAERARLRPLRRRDPAAGALGGRHREALRLPDGHGVGQGRRHRRDVHRPGAAGDRAVARAAGTFQSYALKSHGKTLIAGLGIGDAVATGPVCLIEERRDIERSSTAASSSPPTPTPTGCRS
jgi:pyruvate, water dikinase